jgi:hypothetical protein
LAIGFDAPRYVLSVYEHEPVGLVVAQLNASSAVPGAYARKIVSGNVGGMFSLKSTTGELIIDNALDFETRMFYNLTVSVQRNAGGSIGYTNVLITVLDSNDHAPIMIAGYFIVAVPEDAPTGTNLTLRLDSYVAVNLHASTTDGDSTINAIVVFELTVPNADIGLHPDGVLYLKQVINREQTPRYALEITAISNGVPGRLTSTAQLTVVVTDANDNEASVGVTGDIEVPLITLLGSRVGAVIGLDSDTGPALRYTLVEEDASASRGVTLVSLDSSSGDLLLRAPLVAGDVYRFRYSVGDTLNDARESTFVTVRVVGTSACTNIECPATTCRGTGTCAVVQPLNVAVCLPGSFTVKLGCLECACAAQVDSNGLDWPITACGGLALVDCAQLGNSRLGVVQRRCGVSSTWAEASFTGCVNSNLMNAVLNNEGNLNVSAAVSALDVAVSLSAPFAGSMDVAYGLATLAQIPAVIVDGASRTTLLAVVLGQTHRLLALGLANEPAVDAVPTSLAAFTARLRFFPWGNTEVASPGAKLILLSVLQSFLPTLFDIQLLAEPRGDGNLSAIAGASATMLNYDNMRAAALTMAQPGADYNAFAAKLQQRRRRTWSAPAVQASLAPVLSELQLYAPRFGAPTNVSLEFPPELLSLRLLTIVYNALVAALPTVRVADGAVLSGPGNFTVTIERRTCAAWVDFTFTWPDGASATVFDLPGCPGEAAVAFLEFPDDTLFTNGQKLLGPVVSIVVDGYVENPARTLPVFKYIIPYVGARSPLCVHWVDAFQHWDHTLCAVATIGAESVTCHCKTFGGWNFGLIDAGFEQSGTTRVEVSDNTLFIATYIGLAMHIPFLLLMFFTFVCVRRFRTPVRWFLGHFAITLAAGTALYALGFVADTNKDICTGVSVATHFCLLAAYAFFVLAMIVLLRKNRFALRNAPLPWIGLGVPTLAGYLLPGAGVAVSAWRQWSLYTMPMTNCWLTHDVVAYAYLVPAAVLLGLGLLLAVAIATNVAFSGAIVSPFQGTMQENWRRHRSRSLLAAALTVALPVLGVTWLFWPWYFTQTPLLEASHSMRTIAGIFVGFHALPLLLVLFFGDKDVWVWLKRGCCCSRRHNRYGLDGLGPVRLSADTGPLHWPRPEATAKERWWMALQPAAHASWAAQSANVFGLNGGELQKRMSATSFSSAAPRFEYVPQQRMSATSFSSAAPRFEFPPQQLSRPSFGGQSMMMLNPMYGDWTIPGESRTSAAWGYRSSNMATSRMSFGNHPWDPTKRASFSDWY